MLYNQQLPDYYPTMHLDGFSPFEILEAHRRTNRKKKKDDSFLEKMFLDIIQKSLKATLDQALDDMFGSMKQ